MAPAGTTKFVLLHSRAGVVALVFLTAVLLSCLGSLPWTLSSAGGAGAGSTVPRYNAGSSESGLLPPRWWPGWEEERSRASGAGAAAGAGGWMGTDVLGRDVLVRCLAGGGISLVIGISAAMLSVLIGTGYGAISGYAGGRVDAVLMRIVDVLYGLPYILLVVLLAVAVDSAADEWVGRARARETWVIAEARAAEPGFAGKPRDAVVAALAARPEWRAELEARAMSMPGLKPRDLSESQRLAIGLGTLLVAIAGVSWLTTARVIRGQVLSLKEQPFVEAARAIGASPARILAVHILPNLIGTITVYATLAVPQAILQESFLSFLGIGVQPPLPSWGNLASEGLAEINPYRSHWWLIFFPCVLLALTLLALNFLGEALRKPGR